MALNWSNMVYTQCYTLISEKEDKTIFATCSAMANGKMLCLLFASSFVFSFVFDILIMGSSQEKSNFRILDWLLWSSDEDWS